MISSNSTIKGFGADLAAFQKARTLKNMYQASPSLALHKQSGPVVPAICKVCVGWGLAVLLFLHAGILKHNSVIQDHSSRQCCLLLAQSDRFTCGLHKYTSRPEIRHNPPQMWSEDTSGNTGRPLVQLHVIYIFC